MLRSESTTIEVSPEIARLIELVVTAGEYADASELIGDVLRSWRAEGDDLGFAPEEMNRLIDEGIASGPSGPADFAEIKREVRRRAEPTNAEA